MFSAIFIIAILIPARDSATLSNVDLVSVDVFVDFFLVNSLIEVVAPGKFLFLSAMGSFNFCSSAFVDGRGKALMSSPSVAVVLATVS